MSETPRVERNAGLAWIRGSGVCRQWNGIEYKLGMSGKNVGAQHLSMNVAMIPPGGVAGAHIHVDAVHDPSSAVFFDQPFGADENFAWLGAFLHRRGCGSRNRRLAGGRRRRNRRRTRMRLRRFKRAGFELARVRPGR